MFLRHRNLEPYGRWHATICYTLYSFGNQIVKMTTKAVYLLTDSKFFCIFVGTIDYSDMFDYLNFTKKGYLKLVEPLSEEIQTLLKNFLTADTASTGASDVDQ